MSADEIVFDEIKYREPVRARRPDRDPARACIAYQVPRPVDLPIFLDRRPADAIERHALRDTSVELGGVLLGRECVDDQTGEPFVWVTEHLEAKHYENTQASFTYTHDAWEEMTRERDRRHPDLDIVGWYHTHPDFGIFLSGHDLFLHRNFFGQPLQVAYVIDPIRQHRGFFRWRGDGLEQVGGYYLTGDRADRVALARQVDDLESIASTEPPSGGFSPRLEAELIAMLSRPHVSAAPAAAADRALLGAAFGGLGLILGALIVGAASWMASLNGHVRDQSAALAEMRAKLDRTDEVSQAAVATLLTQGGSTSGPKGFVEELTRTRASMTEARDLARNNETLAAAAAAQVRAVALDRDAIQKAAAKAEAGLADAEARLKDQKEELVAMTADRDRLRDADPGVLSKNYNTAWYAAVGGWAVAALVATAWLIRGFFAALPPAPAANRPDRPQPPTVTIS